MSNKGCVDCAEPWPAGDEPCNCVRADIRDRWQASLSGGPWRLDARARLGSGKERNRTLPPLYTIDAVPDCIRGEPDSSVPPPNRIGAVRNCTLAGRQPERCGFEPQHCSSELQKRSRQPMRSSSTPPL